MVNIARISIVSLTFITVFALSIAAFYAFFTICDLANLNRVFRTLGAGALGGAWFITNRWAIDFVKKHFEARK